LHEIAPAVFTLLDDGLAYVKSDQVRSAPGGSVGMALVPDDLEEAVTEAAEECPGSASSSSRAKRRRHLGHVRVGDTNFVPPVPKYRKPLIGIFWTLPIPAGLNEPLPAPAYRLR
jgi:ferredoxin